MSIPEPVRSVLGEEPVTERVALGDEDALFVTPTRTLLYRSQSLLSDESVDEFPHTAERIALSSGRRKTTVELDYGLEGTRTLTVPTDRLDAVLHPLLAGVLSAAGVIDSGETVRKPFRFSELTLVVTDDQLIKHVGRALWDEEFERVRFADVEGFAIEEGRVTTEIVLTVSGRAERLKVPNERARAVRERLEAALLAYHGIETLAELPGPDESDERNARDGDLEAAFSGPLEAHDPPEAAVSLHERGDTGDEQSRIARLDALATAIDAQQALLDRQRDELDRLREGFTHDR